MNEGTLLRLYGPGWPGSRTASGRFVVESTPDISPWVTLVTADAHRVLPRDQVERAVWDAAVEQLATAPGSWVASGEGRLSITSSLAAELILDQKRLALASTRLEASRLIASVPLRGKITVMVDTDRHRALLFAETRQSFDDARGDRVCRYPFIIQNGRTIGLVRDPPVEEKPWWKPW